MKKVVYFTTLLLTAMSTRVAAQETSIFPRGEKAPNVHHTGAVWLHELSEADSTFNYNIAVATFEPGAKLDWHTHPGGQILLITEGTGYYQEKGRPRQMIHKGNVIKCLPGVEHWHGATPESAFAYVAITMNQPTIWLERVTDEKYSGVE